MINFDCVYHQQRCQVLLSCHILYCFDENTSKIAGFRKNTNVYCTMGENTAFSSKILVFSPKDTANLFARLAFLHQLHLTSQYKHESQLHISPIGCECILCSLIWHVCIVWCGAWPECSPGSWEVWCTMSAGLILSPVPGIIIHCKALWVVPHTIKTLYRVAQKERNTYGH